ncbi:MAG: hypothetical protein ABR549_06295 [Mycobacteriales bacterium]
MTNFESVPTTWDDIRDGQFFRIVGHVLRAQLVDAGTTLLAANDTELTAA